MTVTTTLDRQYFPADGTNRNFPFNFKFFDNSQIYVYVINSSGVASLKTLNVDYTLTGALSPSGGLVVMTVAPANLGRVFIQRIIPVVQPTSIRNQGAFFPAIHEDVFDRLTMLVQQAIYGAINSMKKSISGLSWDFEGLRGENAADPINDQDVATKKSVELYVSSILLTGQGPVNNAANVLYVKPNGVPAVVQGMSGADGSDYIGHNGGTVGDSLDSLALSQTVQDGKILALETEVDSLSGMVSRTGIYPGQHFASYNGGGQISLLKKMMADPFVQSLGVLGVGDSITWGMTTTGMGALEPRAGALTDARNNGDAPSWFNLFHKWLGSEFYGGVPVVEAIWPGTPSGVAQFTYTKSIDVFPGFTPFTNIGGMSQLVASGSTLGVLWYVNMSVSGGGPHSFSWVMTGDSFDIRFAATPEGAAYRLYIGGSLIGTYATSSIDLGIPISFQNTRTHDFTFQRNVTIKIEAVGGNAARDTLRIESVRLNRKLRVTNQGIVGVATERYRTVLLPSAMRVDDSFCLVQLGTNDRGMPAAIDNPTSPSSFSRNLGLLLDSVTGAGITPILFCANETEDNGSKFFSMGQVRAVISAMSSTRSIDFIDQFALTKRLSSAGVTYLSDGLHPNDLGHYLMFENIRNSIGGSSV